MSDATCGRSAAFLGADVEIPPSSADLVQLRAHFERCAVCAAAFGPDLALLIALDQDGPALIDVADVRRAAVALADRTDDDMRAPKPRRPTLRRVAAALVVVAIGVGLSRRACAPGGGGGGDGGGGGATSDMVERTPPVAPPVAPPAAPHVAPHAVPPAAAHVVRSVAASARGSAFREVRRDASGMLVTVRTTRAAPIDGERR